MTLQLSLVTRRSVPTLLALALALGVAACGGSGSGNDGVVSLASPSAAPGASNGPAASTDPAEAIAAFNACMKQHGVDVQMATVAGGDGGAAIGGSVNSSGTASGPGTGPGTAVTPQDGTGEFDPQKLQEADNACRSLLPSGILGDPSATIPPEQVDQMLTFAKCMRDHGVNYPDPQFSGGGMTVQVGVGPNGQGGVDPSSKEFQAAQDACGKDMPGGGIVIGGSNSTPSKP